MLDAGLRSRWLVNVAAGAVAVGTTARAPSVFAVHRSGRVRTLRHSMVASELEVVTVTDRSVVLTWTTRARDRAGIPRPVPADTEVRIAAADGRATPRQRYLDTRRTAFHHAEIGGLEPGRAYRFEAYSDGRRATPARTLVTRGRDAPECTGIFTTLTPPPGRLLRTVALANDVHVGERISGLLLPGLPTGLRHDTDDHATVMLEALLDDLRRPDRAADHLVLAGDLTDSGTLPQSRAVRARLDAWGELGSDYFACRGNHDAPREHDDWGSVFHAHQRLTSHTAAGLRFVGLDTTRPRGSGGTLAAAQLARLREELTAEPDRPTLVFGHHPATSSAAVSNPCGPGFVLDRASGAALHALYRRAPGVFLHHSGHTHRNRLGRPDSGIAVEFLEVGAIKEYPGGYMMLRIHEGGYMANFYKTRSDAALRWSTRTRRQFFGLHPDHALGGLTDRNHVVLRDFSGISGGTRPSASRCT